jgi:hypothetical protein
VDRLTCRPFNECTIVLDGTQGAHSEGSKLSLSTDQWEEQGMTHRDVEPSYVGTMPDSMSR